MRTPLTAEFEELNKSRLVNYSKFLLRHYRLVDANWFLEVEDNIGLDVATKFNEKIWTKLGEIAARNLIKYMNFEKGGLENALEALRYFPWTIIADWKIIEKTEKKVVIIANKCPPQEARLRNNRKVFQCQTMEKACLENFMKVFDSSIKVKCLRAPPDPKYHDYWCMWEFSLE